MATRHPQMSFRDRVTTALFDDIYVRDLEFDAKIIAEIERLQAIEQRARRWLEPDRSANVATMYGRGCLDTAREILGVTDAP